MATLTEGEGTGFSWSLAGSHTRFDIMAMDAVRTLLLDVYGHHPIEHE